MIPLVASLPGLSWIFLSICTVIVNSKSRYYIGWSKSLVSPPTLSFERIKARDLKFFWCSCIKGTYFWDLPPPHKENLKGITLKKNKEPWGYRGEVGLLDHPAQQLQLCTCLKRFFFFPQPFFSCLLCHDF